MVIAEHFYKILNASIHPSIYLSLTSCHVVFLVPPTVTCPPTTCPDWRSPALWASACWTGCMWATTVWASYQTVLSEACPACSCCKSQLTQRDVHCTTAWKILKKIHSENTSEDRKTTVPHWQMPHESFVGNVHILLFVLLPPFQIEIRGLDKAFIHKVLRLEHLSSFRFQGNKISNTLKMWPQHLWCRSNQQTDRLNSWGWTNCDD